MVFLLFHIIVRHLEIKISPLKLEALPFLDLLAKSKCHVCSYQFGALSVLSGQRRQQDGGFQLLARNEML